VFEYHCTTSVQLNTFPTKDLAPKDPTIAMIES
jgi:hypothetical protein